MYDEIRFDKMLEKRIEKYRCREKKCKHFKERPWTFCEAIFTDEICEEHQREGMRYE